MTPVSAPPWTSVGYRQTAATRSAAVPHVGGANTNELMTKINNTQRAAFTKMLKEAMETFQRTSDGTIYVNEYRNPEEYDGPEVAAAIKRHKVVALTAAVEAAQKALKTAYQQVRDDMEGHNAEKRTRREAELQAYTDAIREVWAAETVEEAKAVFARFPKA